MWSVAVRDNAALIYLFVYLFMQLVVTLIPRIDSLFSSRLFLRWDPLDLDSMIQKPLTFDSNTFSH